jgi:hypothetical protein
MMDAKNNADEMPTNERINEVALIILNVLVRLQSQKDQPEE